MKNEMDDLSTNGSGGNDGESRKRILLADDDSAVRESLAQVLESEGYEVIRAGNGHEAMRQFMACRPDLVLLDLKMPGKDGWGTFESMEKMRPFLPVILITALPHQFDRAMGVGIDAIMEKPLNFPVLLEAIRNLLCETKRDRIARLTHREFVTMDLSSGKLVQH